MIILIKESRRSKAEQSKTRARLLDAQPPKEPSSQSHNLRRLAIKLAQEALDLAVILLCFLESGLNVLEGGSLVGFRDGTGFILAGAVVLDFLAGFFDLV